MSEIQQSLNLHNLLQNVSYDNGVICTYTFDPEFFEEYCLERFNSLKNNGNLSVIVDFDTYQQVITAPPEYRPKQANIRYLLHPISVAGRFHPKLFLLVNRNKGRLIVGSANFTRPGITANAEMINYFDYEEEKNEEYAFLFRAAFAFLNDLNQRKPNTALTSNLAAMERIAPWLVADAGFAMNSDVMLLHNLNQPLWDQILHHVKGPVDGVCILSRFFDSTPKILDRIENDLQPKYVKIFTQNVITTLTKEWFKHPLFKSGKLIISCCSYADEGHSQNLHAKALAIIKDDKCIISFGSANFTTQALLKTADGGNVECLVLIPSLSKKDADPDKLFDPQSTAEQLFDEQSLKTAPRQKVDQGEKQQIHIYEANLSGDKIQVQARIDQGVEYEDILAKILFHNEAYSRLLLYPDQGEIYYTESAAKIIKRLGESSSVITLEARKAGEIVATSNALLVTNLIDIRTGQSVRRERHIKEAQQSAIDFFRILDSLIREGEENSLLTFFNFCDIPIIDVASSPYLRSIRPEWDPGKGMRILGIRNLKIFNDLHGAAINFYTRHFKKLQRHV